MGSQGREQEGKCQVGAAVQRPRVLCGFVVLRCATGSRFVGQLQIVGSVEVAPLEPGAQRLWPTAPGTSPPGNTPLIRKVPSNQTWTGNRHPRRAPVGL